MCVSVCVRGTIAQENRSPSCIVGSDGLHIDDYYTPLHTPDGFDFTCKSYFNGTAAETGSLLLKAAYTKLFFGSRADLKWVPCVIQYSMGSLHRAHMLPVLISLVSVTPSLSLQVL